MMRTSEIKTAKPPPIAAPTIVETPEDAVMFSNAISVINRDAISALT